jgi:arginase
MPASAIELIAAPAGLGLSRPDGRVPRVDLLPQALLEAGLGQGLQLIAASPVRVPAYVPLRDPATGVHNGLGIAAVAHELADRVQAARAASRFALVLIYDPSLDPGRPAAGVLANALRTALAAVATAARGSATLKP